jgi:hypothetical protein
VGGIPTLPLGTLTIQETKAPAGYLINNTVNIVHILEDGANPGAVVTYNAPQVADEVRKLT